MANVLPRRPFRLLIGAAVALTIAVLVFTLLAAVSAVARAGAASRVDLLRLLWMTTVQAGLSTTLSLIVGMALAWALNRLHFFGRDLVVALLAAAIVTPGVVVAFGLLAVWGRSGWISRFAQLFGLHLEIPIFGLGGILAAHVILDGAFAARILLARLDGIPESRLKLGQSLALSAGQRFFLLDWPALQGALPGLAAVIFLLAFTSFPIVLLLGGGPNNQTLEVAIYSAVRLDFDLQGAVALAYVQIAVCAAIVLLASAVAPVPVAIGSSPHRHLWRDRKSARFLQMVVLGLGISGFGLPLLSVLLGGLGANLLQLVGSLAFWRAIATSFGVAGASAVLALFLTIAIGMARAATGALPLKMALGAPAYAYLAVPAIVLSLGFFLLFRSHGMEPNRWTLAILITANALLALPFSLATLAPPLQAIATSRGRLIRSLGLTGRTQFLAVELPLLGRDLGTAFALSFCFSLGDLGVISFFGTEDFATLPLLMVRALGAYRTHDAATIAALLFAVTLVAFFGLPRLFARLANAPA